MVFLFNKQTGEPLGDITAEQWAFLQSQLEVEGLEDHDYFINEPELTVLEESGGDPGLIQLLRQSLDGNGELEIMWRDT